MSLHSHDLAWCYYCNSFIFNRSLSKYFCQDCYKILSWFPSERCAVCLNYHSNVACPQTQAWGVLKMEAVFYYREPLQKWFVQLKYSNNDFNAGVFADLVSSHKGLMGFLNSDELDLILPVPSKPKLLSHSGNNSLLILQSIAERFNLRLRQDLVKKRRSIDKQVSLNKVQRELNFAPSDIFSASEELRGKHVLVYDDVCTTGSTLKNMINLLLSIPVASVRAFVIFREV